MQIVICTGQGWYVYIETSFPRKPNDTARIISPRVKGNGSSKAIRCVSFWYHMYGPHVDVLRLYKKQGSSLGKPRWTRQGDQGNKWIQGEYTLEHVNDVQVTQCTLSIYLPRISTLITTVITHKLLPFVFMAEQW